ncbi:MAG: prepilin-type N-terminal cleavage/methylation domain-containing protein [Planctomycetota bacterium]|jgi:prepilin-type N-terminal cleavage/methylation domain-containing protein
MKRAAKLSSASDYRGFTLVELLVALVVTSVVLTAVATLAYAVSSANDATDDTDQKQAQLRTATVRILELVRHCRLVCSVSSEDFALWRSDDNWDGQININELVYVEWGPAADHLRLCEFPVYNGSAIPLSSIQALSTNWWSAYSSDINYVLLVPQCSNVQFNSDAPPPNTRFVTILFELVENRAVRQYQVSAGLRGWAGCLLKDGEIVSMDDD